MTESQWNASGDPQAMLTLLRNTTTGDRKYRLFACACCRLIWDEFPDQRNRDLVIAVEDHPNGKFDDPQIRKPAIASSACESECRHIPAYWVAKYLGRGFYKMTAAFSAAVVSAKVLFLRGHEHGREVEECLFRLRSGGDSAVRLPPALPASLRPTAAAQADLLRCIFGNPLNPGSFDPSWRTETAILLAKGMYESRDFGAMPILADALQEAGGEDEKVLEHCRRGGVHARGCHVLDWILGKE